MSKELQYTITLGIIFLLSGMFSLVQAQENSSSVELNWLTAGPPEIPSGVSWGVPWPEGEVSPAETFFMQNRNGQEIPVQNWTMATWPDGSVKWSGFAMVTSPSMGNGFRLVRGQAASKPDQEIGIRESDTTYEIDTGPLQVLISKWGGSLIRSMTVNGTLVARSGELVAVVQNGVEDDPWNSVPKTKYSSRVNRVSVEQSGPIQAVVKVEGVHKSVKDGREMIPFVVRFYFYADRKPIRMVHTIVYDGDQNKDFIRGLGIHFKVPMREQIQNRHIRFSGNEGGLWSEPIQPLIGRGGRFVKDPQTKEDVYPQQLAGKRVPNRDEVDEQSRYYMSDWVAWSDFKLTQPNVDGFTIQKRTNSQSAWIPAGAGQRASGLVFAGDVSGGLAVSMKDFWQSYPSSLEVRNAAGSEADMYVWLWSPDTPAMDMRHYDTRPHGLESAYEDVQQGFSTPYGVARTSELMLYPTENVPAKEQTAQMAQLGTQPSLLHATPEYLHSVEAFGNFWGLPDRSTSFKREVEDRLASLIEYYQKSVEQHNWYGFWDYGDVMHSYDSGRHVWRYDLGGMAWANTELMPDMWLWYNFLRTGRADIFRMAEAMTRHTQEVDVHHIGRFAGFGSRHNVRHWGGGAKEVRINQAPLKRFYYYLTTDERTRDLIVEVGEKAAQAITDLDPMRLAQPIDKEEFEYPGRLRLGPDWLALAGNWMAMWEITGDTKWRDLIYNGMDSIAAFPMGFRTGRNLVVGFDPETGRLYQLSDELGNYNLSTIQGGGELAFELTELVDHEEWKKTWLQYCRLTYAPREVILRDMETYSEGEDGSYARPDRLAAYAYMKTGNPVFAERALRSIVRMGGGELDTTNIEGSEVLNPIVEADRVSTNSAAQNSLIAIQVLEMCADELPGTMPESDRE